MSMKRTWPISSPISFLISAGIQELTLHYASFINLLLVQVSRGKAADYRTILRKYVVKLPLPAKRQDWRVIVFAQNHAVLVYESSLSCFGANDATICSKHGSPRSGSQKGCSFSAP